MQKLQQLTRDLQNSRALLEIPNMVEHFENETNKKFNQSINVEYLKQYRLDPLVKTKAEQGQTLKQVRN